MKKTTYLVSFSGYRNDYIETRGNCVYEMNKIKNGEDIEKLINRIAKDISITDVIIIFLKELK